MRTLIRLLAVTATALVAAAAPGDAAAVGPSPLPSATVVPTVADSTALSVDEKGRMVWSDRSERGRYDLVLGRVDGSARRVVTRQRRNGAFDAVVGRLSGRDVVIWSSCERGPVSRSQYSLMGGMDFASGRDCRLRVFDIERGRSRWVHTGRGSAFRPAIAQGRLLFFREQPGFTSIIEQTLGGRKRRSHGRVTDTPTSLTADADTIAWTTAIPLRDRLASRSALFTRDRDGGRATLRARSEVEGVYGGGFLLSSAQIVDGLLLYLASAGGKSSLSMIRVLPAQGTTTEPLPYQGVAVPASTRAAATARGQPMLIATGFGAGSGCCQIAAWPPR